MRARNVPASTGDNSRGSALQVIGSERLSGRFKPVVGAAAAAGYVNLVRPHLLL
jgi:hypothetical protein